MPLLRQSLYQQNIGLYLAPTADARDTWAPLMQTVGAEGRCFVLSANQCQRRGHLPDWIRDPAKAVAGNEAAGPDARDLSPSAHSTSKATRRRSSVVAKTEEGHEIAIKSASPATVEESPFEHSKEGIKGASPSASQLFSNPDDNEFVSRGGSCIVGPQGQMLKSPLWEVDDGGLLVVEADLEDCERGRLDLDVAGSYSRNDSFKLTVAGLDLNPPP